MQVFQLKAARTDLAKATRRLEGVPRLDSAISASRAGLGKVCAARAWEEPAT